MAAALESAYTGVTAVVTGLSDRDLLLPSGCRGWTVADLLLHVQGDAQRALVALHTPAAGPPDVDFVSYWRGFPGGSEELGPNVHWIRRTAAAFQRPGGIVELWSDTAPAAAHAARTAEFAAFVATQGHVLAVPDFLATLVTEAVIHHLDLVAELPGAPAPADDAVGIAVATLAGLAGPAGLPAHWTPLEALRKATGRSQPDVADSRFPLIG